jgi:hypothetical protein
MGNKTFRSHLKLQGDSLTHLPCKIFGIKPLMEWALKYGNEVPWPYTIWSQIKKDSSVLE